MNEYKTISGEFWKAFDKGLEMTLATSAGNDVTARTVSVAPVDEKIYFLTFNRSVKYRQIQQNPHVALCVGPIHIQGVARITESLTTPESKKALEALSVAFPDDIAMYSQMPGGVVIEVKPVSGGFGRIKTGGMYVIDFSMEQAHKLNFG